MLQLYPFLDLKLLLMLNPIVKKPMLLLLKLAMRGMQVADELPPAERRMNGCVFPSDEDAPRRIHRAKIEFQRGLCRKKYGRIQSVNVYALGFSAHRAWSSVGVAKPHVSRIFNVEADPLEPFTTPPLRTARKKFRQWIGKVSISTCFIGRRAISGCS